MSVPCFSCKKSNIIQHTDEYEICPRPFGSNYYYHIFEEFECFNPCEECKRSCDRCDEVGEIETVICHYCDSKISNCKVFTCFNEYCKTAKCLNCARPDNNTGLCVDCFVEMCEANHEWNIAY